MRIEETSISAIRARARQQRRLKAWDIVNSARGEEMRPADLLQAEADLSEAINVWERAEIRYAEAVAALRTIHDLAEDEIDEVVWECRTDAMFRVAGGFLAEYDR